MLVLIYKNNLDHLLIQIHFFKYAQPFRVFAEIQPLVCLRDSGGGEHGASVPV